MKKFLLIFFAVLVFCNVEKLSAQVSSVTLNAPTALTEQTITLNAEINTDASTDVSYSFEYGTTSGLYGNIVSGSETAVDTNRPVSEGLTSLAAGTQYFYQFTASSILPASSVTSSESSFWTYSNVTSTAVAGFQRQSATTTSITLEWTAQATDITGYLIVYNTGGTAPDETGLQQGIAPASLSYTNKVVIEDALTTSTTINGLTANAEYSFRIIPYNVGSDPATTNYKLTGNTTLTSYTLETVTSNAITDFGVRSKGNNNIELEWTAETTDNDGYLILWATGSTAPDPSVDVELGIAPGSQTFSNKIVKSGSSSTSQDITGLTAGTEYSFVIIPYNEGVNVATTNYNVTTNSEVSTFTLADQPSDNPGTPTFISSTPTSITLEFAKSDGATKADGYFITYRTGTSAPGNPGAIDGTDGSSELAESDVDGTYTIFSTDATISATIPGLNPGTEYSFRIMAFSSDATNNPSSYNYKTNGITFQNNNSFTLATEPATAVSNLTMTSATESAINFSFEEYTFANNGGFVLYYQAGSTAPDLSALLDGFNPDNQTGLSLDYGLQITDDATTISTDGNIVAGSEYSVTIVPYNYDGNNFETFNYRKSDAESLLSVWSLSTAASGGAVANAGYTVDNATSNSLDVTYTAVANAGGYLILYSEGNSAFDISDVMDGQSPSQIDAALPAGISLFDNGTNLTETIGSLNSDTEYAFYVIPYTFTDNGGAVSETYNYNTASPVLKTGTTLCSTGPTVGSASIANDAGALTTTSVKTDLTNVPVDAESFIVARLSADALVAPTDGVAYTADNDFGTGAQTGSGNDVVLAGVGTSVTTTSLSPFTEYAFDYYVYNPNGHCYSFVETITVTTLCDPATTEVSNTSIAVDAFDQITLNWTIDGIGNNVLIIARETATSAQAPTTNVDYAENNEFGSGQELGTGNFAVYDGNATTVTVTGLSELTDYSFDIYEYNPTNGGFCYNTTAVTLSATTVCQPPESEATFNPPANITAATVDLSWAAVTGADRYLIVAKEGAPVDLAVSNGDNFEDGLTTDIATSSFLTALDGDGTSGNKIVYANEGTSVTITELTGSTQYYFEIYAYVAGTYCYAFGPNSVDITTNAVSATNTLTLNGAATTISSVDNDASANFITVMDFNMNDLGDDGADSKISGFTISAGVNDYFESNAILWDAIIADAQIVNTTNNGGAGIIKSAVISGTDNEISVTIANSENNNDSQFGFLADGGSLNMQLQIRLKESITATDIDLKNFVFEFDPATITIRSGSEFVTTAGTEITTLDNDNEIEVIGSEFEFTTQPPASVIAGENVSPQAVAEVKDANGNLDLDYTTNFTISNTDNIPMQNEPTTFNNGVMTFPANFNYQGSGDGSIIITDNAPGNFNVTSSAVTVDPTIELIEQTAGLNNGTLQSGTNDQAVLGFSIDVLGNTQMQEIVFTTDIDLSNVVNNLRMVESTNNTYEGIATDGVIASSPTIDNGANTITFTGLTEDLTSETKNYFLILDVDASVNEFDNSDLTIALDMANIVFNNSANTVANNIFKIYSFNDIIDPLVDQVIASPTVLSGIDLGADALAIEITFNEEMDPSVIPAISFPTTGENPGSSLIGPNGNSAWSPDNTVYTFYFDLVDQDVLIENIDVLITNAKDKSGNSLADHLENNLFTIDTENPKADLINLNVVSINRPDNTIEMEITFDKVMNNTIDPDFSFNGTTEMSNNGDGAWSGGNTVFTVTFDHSLVEEEVSVANIDITNAQDASGNIMEPATSANFTINTVRSRIENISATNTDGIYKENDLINIEVTFDQDIMVSGNPELDLNSGGVAEYLSTSLNVLTFEYTVAAGENIGDLDVINFNLLGATITNTVGNEAILTLPISPNRLQDNKNIEIDTRSPLVSNIILDKAIISRTETILNVTVEYDEDMDQSSNPLFSFSAGNNMVLESSSWADSQTFIAEFRHDLLVEEERDNVTIEISGATDVVGNTAVTENSGSFDIDTQRPRITQIVSSTANGTYGPGDQINIKVVFDENIQQIGTAPILTLNTGATASFDNITNGNELNFTYTIGATASGENTTDLNVTAISNSQNEILDLVDNPSVLTLPASPNRLIDNSDLIIDTSSPTVTIDLDNTEITRANNQLVLIATYNEDMDQGSTPNFNVQGSGDFILDGGSWDSATEYVATFTHNLTEEEVQNVTIEVSGATDVVGNTAITNTSGTFIIDTQKPRIVEIVSSSPDGLYSPGDIINIQLVFDEDVTVGGTPLLDLNSGGQASFQNVTNGNEVNFVYTVGGVNSGENTNDLDVTAFDLNGGNIRDLLDNDAEILLPISPNRLLDNADLQVDSDPADIANVTATPNQGFFTTGDQIDITIEFNEAVIVSGTPLLSLNTGSTAEFVSGSNSTILTFNYTVEASDGGAILDVADLEYASANSIDLNGGTIEDLAGINASLGLPAVGSANSLSGNTNITIDTQAPELVNNPFTPFNGEFNVSHALTFTIELNEPVSGQGTNNISIIDRQTSNVLAVLDAGTAFTNNTSTILEFDSFESILEDSTEYYIRFEAGALVDRAGNEFAGFIADNIWSFTTFGSARIDDFSIGACVGEVFTIQGQYFTGVSRIRTNINGDTPFTISSFTVVDDETIEFTVPAGTVPGTITLDKQTGQSGNTEDASTTSEEPIKVGPSSAQLVLVDPNSDAICDIDDLGNVNEVDFTVDIVGGNGRYTLVYQVNTNDPITITGYEEGQTFSIVPPDSAENNVSIVSLTDEDPDLNTCSAPDLGTDIEVVKYIRSRVDAGGFENQDDEFGVIELCGANTSVIDFSDLSTVVNSPEISGTVQQGTWTIDEGPSSNGGGFSPDFSLKSVQTDRPDTVKYYASFADGVRGEVVLELTSDDPGGLNPCVGTSDFVIIRFVESISVNSDRNVAICLDEDENGNQIAIANLESTVSGGSASDSLSVEWTRVDEFNEEAGHDGSWGFKDDINQTSYSLTSNVLNPIYKASPQELLEGRATVEILPVLVSGVGCGAIPAPREVDIRINDIPNPTKSSGPEIVCAGDQEVRFRMNTSSPGNTFQWNFTNGLNEFDGATNSNLVFVNFREVATETIDTLVVQEFNPNTGCISKPDTFFISLKPLPIANIKYNSTTTISNTAALIPLEGEGGTEGNLVDATSENGQFSGSGVIQNSNGDYFLDSSQLGVTDITDEEDVHEVIFTFTNEFGCTATDTIAFNVFDAERIFPALAEEYCQLDAPDTISVDNAIIPDGFIVSAINGPGITEIGYTDVVVGNDTISVLRAIFDPETAYANNPNTENQNVISITYSIEDPNDAANNAENVGEQNVIVNPLPELEIDDIEASICTYDERIEFEPIGITGNNYSFELINEGLPDSLVIGDSLEGFEFDPAPLLAYLADIGEDSIRIFIRYTYQNQNSCENSRIYNFVVWRQPAKPAVISQNLCFVDGEMDTAVVVNYDGNKAEEELLWYTGTDFSADPVHEGMSYTPDPNFFTTVNEITFNVIRRNVDSQGEEDPSCVSNATSVTFRKIDNPDFEWNKSTFGVEPVIFTGEPNQAALASTEWIITKINGEEEELLSTDAYAQVNDSSIAVDFNTYGAGRYKVKFKVSTENACSAEVIKEIVILPEESPSDSYTYDFNNSADGWVSTGLKRNSTDTVKRLWDFAIPTADSKFESNETVWITNAEGSYESNIISYVYSPLMDIRGIDRPVVSFDLWINMAEQDDGLILEYSTDNKTIEDPNKTWEVLGDFSANAASGLEWYNTDQIEALVGSTNNPTGYGWSFENDAESINSVNAKHALEEINEEDRDSLIFRFQFKSTASESQFGNRDGAAFDNFKIESLNRNVLIEYFGDSESANDPLEMETIDSVFNETGSFAWINYRINENDPLYKQASASMLSRVYYYDAYELDDQFAIDGEIRQFSFTGEEGDGDFGSNELSRARLFSSISNMDLEASLINESELEINAKFQSVEEIGENVNLFIAILQKEIMGGEQGTDEGITYYNVLRKLLPGNGGVKVSGISGEQTVTFKASLPADENPLAVVAFLQNTETAAIIQSAYLGDLPLLSLPNVTAVDKKLGDLNIKLYPNPARDYLNVQWDIPLQEEAKAKVIDVTGKVIKEFKLERGNRFYNLKTSSLKTGMYTLILTNQDGEHKMMKFAVTN